MSNSLTTTQARALNLLGHGIGPEAVASALGVTTSAISQLLSDEQFSAQVAELRFQNLNKHNERDNKYDSIEDELVEKMKDLIPLMMRPLEVLKAIQVINAAKRRGASAPDSITNQQTIVQINLPSITVTKFTTNIQNQVIQTGQQELLTIQSGTLLKEVKERENDRIKKLASSGATIDI
jgi:hypothetical protein